MTDGVLTNTAGMTLYTFDKDAGGKSACNGPCAANWPPLTAGADAKASGDWSIVTRDDGAKQWAYKGKPVYLWAKDQKPGDKTGTDSTTSGTSPSSHGKAHGSRVGQTHAPLPRRRPAACGRGVRCLSRVSAFEPPRRDSPAAPTPRAAAPGPGRRDTPAAPLRAGADG